MEAMEPALPPVVPSIPRPPPPPWKSGRPPPTRSPTSEDRSSAEGGVVTGLVIGFVASLLVISVLYSLYKGRRDSRARAARHAHTRDDDDERQQPRRASAAAGQPAFTYSPASVKHGVTGGREETAAAPCSVCLGALQLGEMVRLLPACMHLFHMECIDPWLDAHSTCPICRSDTDTSMDVARLPPV